MGKIAETIFVLVMIGLFMIARLNPSYLIEVLGTFFVIIAVLVISFFFGRSSGESASSKGVWRVVSIVVLSIILVMQTVKSSNVVIDYLLNDKQTVVMKMDTDVYYRSAGKGGSKTYIQIKGVEYEIVRPQFIQTKNVTGDTYKITILNGSKKIIEFEKQP